MGNKITLATLPQATAQEVFDQVVCHMLTQNARSYVDGSCLYRGADGMKCAAGCLIGDDEYDQGLEHSSWGNLVASGDAPGAHRPLISRLQVIHDAVDPAVWPEALDEVAEDFGLSPAVIPVAQA